MKNSITFTGTLHESNFGLRSFTDAGETTIPAGLVLANSRPPADVAKNL